RTKEEVLEAALEFKNAPDKKTQEAVLKKYGIRWSELFRLRYWDPTKFVVIEGMHNLFLGLAQHHMRKVLGGDVVKDESQAKPIRIANTRRPLWQESPPRDIGSKSQGKWKADQWRTAFEFDLPVALVLLWATDLDESASWDEDRKLQVVESTMLLATSLRWGTSNRTSPHHAELYTKNMRAYLATIRSLFPDRNLVPNHHNALYLGEMLLRFGPARGWWMFPFERVIGLLQKFNTNNKTGEISRT
ncbi:hypothetical protein FIBSPDRAFT_760231, partial [Athelia psychrophila]